MALCRDVREGAGGWGGGGGEGKKVSSRKNVSGKRQCCFRTLDSFSLVLVCLVPFPQVGNRTRNELPRLVTFRSDKT